MERIIRKFQSEPSVLIQVANAIEMIDFQPLGDFDILDNTGKSVLSIEKLPLKWRVKLGSVEPAKFDYGLLVTVEKSMDKAEQIANQLKNQGHEVRINEVGGMIQLNDQKIIDNCMHQVIIGEFNSPEDAEDFSHTISNNHSVKVIREKIRDLRAQIELFDSEYIHVFELDNHFAIQPKKNAQSTKIFNVLFDHGYSEECRIEKIFQGTLHFRINDSNELIAVSELPLESYLKGILAIHMGEKYPFEALKCQAVVSRSLALASFGYIHENEPFDLCSERHCQLFQDSSLVTSSINKAVEETKGKVLFHQGKICASHYSKVCGGYTAETDKSTHLIKETFLKKVFDGPNGHQNKMSLKNEKTVNRWINSQPNVYCNLNQYDFYSELDIKKEYFRWEKHYTRSELEEIIQYKTNKNIGILFDVIPVNRDNSGRLIEIEILGSRKNLSLIGEMNIRWVLSDATLYSSCFQITKELGADGIPMGYTFWGAGYGHGMGMCQTGAIVQAFHGHKYQDILDYYYHNVEIKRIY